MTKHRPNKEPKFHINEIFAGVGNSIKDLLTIFIKGSFFIGEYIFLYLTLTLKFNGVYKVVIFILSFVYLTWLEKTKLVI